VCIIKDTHSFSFLSTNDKQNKYFHYELDLEFTSSVKVICRGRKTKAGFKNFMRSIENERK